MTEVSEFFTDGYDMYAPIDFKWGKLSHIEQAEILEVIGQMNESLVPILVKEAAELFNTPNFSEWLAALGFVIVEND
jgi:hypothetical protein